MPLIVADILTNIVAAKRCGNHTWREIGAFVGKSGHTVRVKYYRQGRTIHEAGPCPICNADEPLVIGLTADWRPPDDVWDRAIAIQDRYEAIEEQRQEQYIGIPGDKAFAWAWLSDLHPGGAADYRQMRQDAEVVRDTPRMWCAFNGDGPNNWITSKLAHLQRLQSLSHDDEWMIFLSWLEIVKPKLKVVSLGNHDVWTLLLAETDRIREAVSDVRVLYDAYEVTYQIELEGIGQSWIVKQRHQWRGSSVFNVTHGIEVGWQRGSCEFDVGVGSHTHTGTVCRPFFRHGVRKYAVLIGAYASNRYSRQLGLAPTVGRGCGAMVFKPDGGLHFFEDLETAAEFLRFLNMGR